MSFLFQKGFHWCLGANRRERSYLLMLRFAISVVRCWEAAGESSLWSFSMPSVPLRTALSLLSPWPGLFFQYCRSCSSHFPSEEAVRDDGLSIRLWNIWQKISYRAFLQFLPHCCNCRRISAEMSVFRVELLLNFILFILISAFLLSFAVFWISFS